MTDIVAGSIETNDVLASAVVIPDAPATPEQSTPSPPVDSKYSKRRLSDVSEREAKKPRLSEETDDDTLPNDRPVINGAQESTVTHSEPALSAGIEDGVSQRKNTRDDEKKRGKRLFGGLLGTLSQSSTTPAQRRRAEIERKQQAKLKAQDEEHEEDKKKRLQRLISQRTIQQQEWDEQAMHVRHSNKRAMANMLSTRSEPKIYYLPFELQSQEKHIIESQKEDAEADIERELEDVTRLRRRATGGEAAPDEQPQTSQHVETLDQTSTQADRNMLTENINEHDLRQTTQPVGENQNSESPPIHNQEQLPMRGVVQGEKDREGDKADENDDVMVEAGEDSVIY